MNRIGGIIVSVLASSEQDSWFESHLDQTKDYNIGSCFFFIRHAVLRSKTYLPADCCFNIPV